MAASGRSSFLFFLNHDRSSSMNPEVYRKYFFYQNLQRNAVKHIRRMPSSGGMTQIILSTQGNNFTISSAEIILQFPSVQNSNVFKLLGRLNK